MADQQCRGWVFTAGKAVGLRDGGQAAFVTTAEYDQPAVFDEEAARVWSR